MIHLGVKQQRLLTLSTIWLHGYALTMEGRLSTRCIAPLAVPLAYRPLMESSILDDHKYDHIVRLL